jgi:cytochrome b6-f complex iron-sulfur subunit
MAKKRGMSRRDFFRKSWLGAMGVGLGGFGLASVQFLWPSLSGGFGSQINLGGKDDLEAALAAAPGGVVYFAEARTYLIAYKPTPGQEAFYDETVRPKDLAMLAVYQKCAHLGCKVPHCESSHWLECPCHGSRYNKAGEYKFGPAPRGLSHFPLTLDGDAVVVDTFAPKEGPPRGTDTINQEPEGPHCET